MDELDELVTVDRHGDTIGILSLTPKRLKVEQDDSLRAVAYRDITDISVQHKSRVKHDFALFMIMFSLSALSLVTGLFAAVTVSLPLTVVTVLGFCAVSGCYYLRTQAPTVYRDRIRISIRDDHAFRFSVRSGMGKDVVEAVIDKEDAASVSRQSPPTRAEHAETLPDTSTQGEPTT